MAGILILLCVAAGCSETAGGEPTPQGRGGNRYDCYRGGKTIQ
ncbi:hypothetical protein [Methanogenium cariaci]|nr:hypothetical protein [Methanogenium cariaci]